MSNKECSTSGFHSSGLSLHPSVLPDIFQVCKLLALMALTRIRCSYMYIRISCASQNWPRPNSNPTLHFLECEDRCRHWTLRCMYNQRIPVTIRTVTLYYWYLFCVKNVRSCGIGLLITEARQSPDILTMIYLHYQREHHIAKTKLEAVSPYLLYTNKRWTKRVYTIATTYWINFNRIQMLGYKYYLLPTQSKDTYICCALTNRA